MKRLGLALLAIVLFNHVARAEKPLADVEHVIIISVDGLRPDLLLRGNAPAIRSMMDHGSYSLWARTTAVAITLPSHISMLTGVIPQAHGIHWNDDLPLSQPIYPRSPTIFEKAHAAQITTGLAAGKKKFAAVFKPESLDWTSVPEKTGKDRDVMEAALSILRAHAPGVLFVHLAGVDTVGHSRGWGSADYMTAVADADSAVASLLAALDELKLRQKTAIILTADHGGRGRTHGADDVRSRHIPWICTGPGVRENYDLTLDDTLEIDTYDTFATTCWLLDIPNGTTRWAKPITQILPKGELLKPTTK